MYLDYSKLEFDRDGNPEVPELVLRTLSDKVIGVIPGVCNLKLNIKYSEPSEISFDVPSKIDGIDNPLYESITGYKQIYTKCYGIYEILSPSIEMDGISEIKHVQGYSYEKTLESKKFFLEEGTFNFWNPALPTDTVLGRILEIATGWSAGYVSASLIGRYRTFDDYDDYLLSFIYSNAPDKYRCVFVFDTYKKTINVYDADEEIGNIPIYLSFDNLLENMDVTEKSDELVTAIRPYGADDIDIRAVNPIGTNWIYDLSYFIANGDISDPLASKWTAWQRSIINRQMYYKGLVSLQASSNARILAEQAALTDLNGQLDTLTAQQSVTIQALAMETTSAGKASQQAVLDDINKKITAKKAEIASKQATISSIQSELDSYTAEIQAVTSELAIKNYFTSAEYEELSHFLIEQDITESTFVATTVDTSVSGTSYSLANESINISGSSIWMVDLSSKFAKQMYVMSGGTFALSGAYSISGDIIRGTLETKNDGSFVMSFYAGTIRVNNKTAESGTITITGKYTGLSSNIGAVTVDEVTTYEGTTIRFTASSGSMFLTANVSEYQKYSVQMELYDYAVGVLSDLATPTYEFTVESGNFLFEYEFAPFRKQLELGKGVYLRIGDSTITPYIIEFELSFEDRSSFSIVFSNRFKRHDETNTLKDMIETSYSTSRSFDASKYIYNQTTSQASSVSKFMSDSLDAAKNTILAAANQSVIINGSGIHVGGDSKYQLRLVDRMLAMTDDNWEHAKLAIGLFSSPDIGEYFGVNAEVVGGKLIVGNNLVIENENDRGVMQFKVDSTGAWLYNSTFVLQSDGVAPISTISSGARAIAAGGGKIILDPMYGILAGTGDLFDVNGTTVIPSFITSSGSIKFDSDNMPVNSNFFLDIRDGSAYFRGRVRATSGEIGGFTLENDFMHTGSGSNYVAMNGSGTNTNSQYAFWAGATNPGSAPFWVKKNGDMSAKNGTFSGTLSAARLSGNLTADASTGGWLIGCGINVGSGNFYVDQNGNVTMKGNINMTNGSITWGNSNSPVRVLYARTQLSTPTSPYAYYPASSSTGWHQNHSVLYDYYASYSYDGGNTWTAAIKVRGEDGRDGHDGQNGTDATVNERNVFNVLTNGGTKFGIFGNSTANTLYINANYIQTGTLNANLIELACSFGGFCKGYGSTGTSMTYGAMMYGSAGSGNKPYILVSNAGAGMFSTGSDFYVAGNIISASTEISVRSDRRTKNSIEYDMDRYEKFFMSLKPTQFRMNDGTSGRYHTGFIAQDVEQALLSAGLSTQDFAGLTIEKLSADFEKNGIRNEYYQLRYGEFISLNTYMIQKLFHRIDELESKLKSLEQRS